MRPIGAGRDGSGLLESGQERFGAGQFGRSARGSSAAPLTSSSPTAPTTSLGKRRSSGRRGAEFATIDNIDTNPDLADFVGSCRCFGARRPGPQVTSPSAAAR